MEMDDGCPQNQKSHSEVFRVMQLLVIDAVQLPKICPQ